MAVTQSRMEKTEPQVRYTEVLEQCRDMSVIFCNSQLAELFEHVGTAFLDFAERAQTNSMQSGFFEAMGLIQRRRLDMEQIFRREINRGFDTFGHTDATAAANDRKESENKDLELSLLGQEEMEESVAAEKIVSRANESFFPQLYALSERLAVIRGKEKLKDTEIPSGPFHLVQSYRQAIEGLQIEVKIKIVLYALFDKFMVQEAKGLYDELNGNLKEAGILPDLKPVSFKSDRQQGGRAEAEGQGPEGNETAADAKASGQTAGSLGEQLFESIIDLMSKGQRSSQAGRAAHPTTPVSPAEAAAASQQLVAAVSQLQAQTNTESAPGMVAGLAQVPNLEIDATFVDKVKETLQRERKQVLSQVDRDKLTPMDMDLIDLIGMLFEYMLNDPVLPNLAKALLSHLHTPYLKVALIDRRLLVDTNHPARHLLDQMVEAGSLWVDESSPQQGIYPAMQRVVDRVLQEFAEDVSLFEELLDYFEKSMHEQQSKTETMEQRIQDAARGREKLQLAKGRAKKEIANLLQRTPLPAPVTNFLNKTWLDRLVFILLHEKEETRAAAWKEAVQIAQDLVALFDPKTALASTSSQSDRVTDLQNRMKEAIQSMGNATPAAMDNLLQFLDAPQTWRESCAKAAADKPQARATQKASKKPTGKQGEAEDKETVSEQEREVIRRLRKMKPGTWFEFASATGGVKRRIKLSWLSPLTATCMFVDRSGMQAEIKTLQELAHEILSGRAKVIPRPKHPFIERALVSIRNMLQTDEPSSTEKISKSQ